MSVERYQMDNVRKRIKKTQFQGEIARIIWENYEPDDFDFEDMDDVFNDYIEKIKKDYEKDEEEADQEDDEDDD